jgi:nucleotide-binding universal stress UspA family protein
MSFDSIVVGMDFSEAAIHSAVWVARCFAPTAEISLVHVIDLPSRPRFVPASMPTRATIEAAAREFAQSQMTNVIPLLNHHAASYEVRVGKPHEEIVKVASERNADLIVIGPHGDRPRPRRLLGTTADRIVRTSVVPVLVGMDLPVGTPEQLLVPVEDAAITPAVLAAARSLPKRFGATVTLLNVWSNAEYSYVASMAHATARSDADARDELERDLNLAARGWLEEMTKDGTPREQIRSLVTYGSVGDSVLQVAEAIDADLIVMGGRGSGLVAPALLGSTVASVLHGAKFPVLVVREAD